jgi:hypothetical protein
MQIERSDEQSRKQIDESDRQLEKTLSPIHESRDPNSKVTDESDGYRQDRAKHRLQSFSTEAGMQMDARVKLSENARSSIQERREPTSKTTFDGCPFLESVTH